MSREDVRSPELELQAIVSYAMQVLGTEPEFPVEVRGQFLWVGSFIPPLFGWGSNSGHQIFEVMVLPSESSHKLLNFLKCIRLGHIVGNYCLIL